MSLPAVCHACFCRPCPTQVIRDYVTPEGKELSRDLLRTLNDIIHFLVACRPLSVTMGNAIRQLKLEITSIEPGTPDAEAKKELIEVRIMSRVIC